MRHVVRTGDNFGQARAADLAERGSFFAKVIGIARLDDKKRSRKARWNLRAFASPSPKRRLERQRACLKGKTGDYPTISPEGNWRCPSKTVRTWIAFVWTRYTIL